MFLYKRIKLLESIVEGDEKKPLELKDSKIKSVVKENVVKTLLNPAPIYNVEEEENDSYLHLLESINHPELELVSRKYEESYMKQATLGNSCANEFNCVGHLLTQLHDWPRGVSGFSLMPFVTPKGKAFRICVLCLRRKTTATYLDMVLHNRTALQCILPYRNNPADYNLGCFLPSVINSKSFGVVDAFVYFSFTHYMYHCDKSATNTIAHRSSHLFYQTPECLPGYKTIESATDCGVLINVGLLLDVSNIIPFVLTHSTAYRKKEKHDEQHLLIEFLKKSIKRPQKKDVTFTKDERIKYHYLINAAKHMFDTQNIYTALNRMVHYFATVWQPDLMFILNKAHVPEPYCYLSVIPLPAHQNYTMSPSLACLSCPARNKKKDEINCSYKYDYLSDRCVCKFSKLHELIEIKYSGNMVQFKNISYLPCVVCKKVMRVSSGTSIPDRGAMDAKNFNKLLKTIRSVDLYTHKCVYCRYHKDPKPRCLMCNLEFAKNTKKPWQIIKVFGGPVDTVYLCHTEKNVKQAAGGEDKIWSYSLLINFLRKH